MYTSPMIGPMMLAQHVDVELEMTYFLSFVATYATHSFPVMPNNSTNNDFQDNKQRQVNTFVSSSKKESERKCKVHLQK